MSLPTTFLRYLHWLWLLLLSFWLFISNFNSICHFSFHSFLPFFFSCRIIGINILMWKKEVKGPDRLVSLLNYTSKKLHRVKSEVCTLRLVLLYYQYIICQCSVNDDDLMMNLYIKWCLPYIIIIVISYCYCKSSEHSLLQH